MNASLEDAQAILARIERLERETYWLKRIGLAALLAGSVGFLMGQAGPQRKKESATAWKEQTFRAGTIQATRIELVAPEGGIRAKLIASSSGVSLLMFDKDGKPSVSLSSVGGPQLIMGELVEQRQLSEGYVSPFTSKQTVYLTGTSSGGELMLADESGKETASMVAFGPSPASGSTGSTHLSLVSDAPTLFVGKRDGYRTEIGTTDLITQATGETHRTSSASVVLFDDKGNVIWRTP